MVDGILAGAIPHPDARRSEFAVGDAAKGALPKRQALAVVKYGGGPSRSSVAFYPGWRPPQAELAPQGPPLRCSVKL